MSRIVVDSSKSLLPPVEVEIDGQVFQVRRIDRDAQRLLVEFDARVRSGDLDASYEQLEFLLGEAAREAINRLDIRQVDDLLLRIVKALYGRAPLEDEKKASAPGERPSSS